jgi:uncharacterized membrane protein YfcA
MTGPEASPFLLLGVALALLVGVALGLLGGGGSILTVPILTEVIGLEPREAIATSLLVVGATSVAALVPHARAGNVVWRTGFVFGGAGMAGALLGGLVAAWIPARVLLLLFTGMMVATALAMIRGPVRVATDARPARTGRIVVDGLVVGLVTGLVGAGGGFLVVPALVLLGGLPMSQAVGTSLLVIALKSAAGFVGHASHTPVDYPTAAAVTASAVVGSVVGSALVPVIPPERLRGAFGVFVLVMALVQLVRGL